MNGTKKLQRNMPIISYEIGSSAGGRQTILRAYRAVKMPQNAVLADLFGVVLWLCLFSVAWGAIPS